MIASLKNLVKRSFAKRRSRGLQFGPGVQVSQSRFGVHVRIGKDAVMLASAIGDYSYVGDRTSLAHAHVGRFCSIGPDVSVGSGTHPSRDWVSTHPIFYQARPALGWMLALHDRLPEFRPTAIGNDVWIGAKALLRDGITVGDGAIIAGGAVVVDDVEPYAVYGGVPARLIRLRFDADQIAFLLSLRWWDRDLAWLREHAPAFAHVDQLREAMRHD